jgi:hypothetical protein
MSKNKDGYSGESVVEKIENSPFWYKFSTDMPSFSFDIRELKSFEFTHEKTCSPVPNDEHWDCILVITLKDGTMKSVSMATYDKSNDLEVRRVVIDCRETERVLNEGIKTVKG